MKQTFTILLLLTIELIARGQTDPIRGKQFQLTGKIIGKVELPAHCGIIAWGTVIEFEVIELVGLSYSNKRIGIIITCPEFYGNKFFKPGKTYQIVFSDKNQANFEWVIPNKELLKKNGISFDPYAVSVEKMGAIK